jgi:hypothetical protein
MSTYVIKYRMTWNGKSTSGRVQGLVFHKLEKAQAEAARLNDGAGQHLYYWAEQEPAWEKQSATQS